MKKYGWIDGKGLGKNLQGILEPIQVATGFSQNLNTLSRNYQNHILPEIVINIGDYKIVALIDTGSEISCVSENCYNQIKTKHRLSTLPLRSIQVFGAFNAKSAKVSIQVLLKFQIE